MNVMDTKYIAALHNCLVRVQMIEEVLKIIVGLSYEIIAARTPAPVRFKFNSAAIQDAPMGRLIKMYAQVSNNEEMTQLLGKIIKWRNFCAHNAFMNESYVRLGNEQFTSHSHVELTKVVKHCSELMQQLGAEVTALQEVHKQIVQVE